LADVVERPIFLAGGILDRAADESHAGGEPDRLCHDDGRVAEALLEVGGYRQIAGLDDHARVGQRLVARHLAVALAEHARLGAAGGRQSSEPERGEHARGARVPRVGDHECPRPFVERAKARGLFALARRHLWPPCRAMMRVTQCTGGIAMPGVRDRVAVVTAAANGLGCESALLLAGEGARVALGDLDAAGLDKTAATITAAGGAAVAVAGDLTEEAPANRLIAACVERFGRIDILVNDVGGSRNAKIWETKVEDWDFVLRLNSARRSCARARRCRT